MTRCIVLLIALALAVPAFAADTIEARMKELVLRAADGTIGSIQSEVSPPGSFGSRPLREQVILHHGTAGLLALVRMADASPLKKKVPPATWAALVAARGTLEQVQGAMNQELHAGVLAALAKRDLLPSRVLVGTANIYLRQLSEEAESLLEKATCTVLAATSAELAARPDAHRAIFALATDPAATPEVRERARHLHPLIAQTAAAAAVAEAQLHEQLGLAGRP